MHHDVHRLRRIRQELSDLYHLDSLAPGAMNISVAIDELDEAVKKQEPRNESFPSDSQLIRSWEDD